MSKFRRKFKWKNILSFVLVGVLLVGSVAGLGAIFNKDTKTISPSAFAVGGINAQGNYEKTDLSIYTKDMFECQGLSIEPDFEATGTYKVFYYDSNKNFIGATEELEATDGVYNKGDKFVVAQYARIMITPDVPTDDDGNEVEDFKIRFYEVTSYASDYTITVSKEQEFAYTDNLFEIDATMDGKLWYGLSSNATLTPIEATSDTYSSAMVDCTGYKKLVVGIVLNGNGAQYNFENLYFGNDESTAKLSTVQIPCSDSNDVGDIVFVTVEIPEGATRFAINYNDRTRNGTFVYGIE